jgi:hypothetical protein
MVANPETNFSEENQDGYRSEVFPIHVGNQRQDVVGLTAFYPGNDSVELCFSDHHEAFLAMWHISSVFLGGSKRLHCAKGNQCDEDYQQSVFGEVLPCVVLIQLDNLLALVETKRREGLRELYCNYFHWVVLAYKPIYKHLPEWAVEKESD